MKWYSDIKYGFIGNLKYHHYHNCINSINNLEKFNQKKKIIIFSPTWFKNNSKKEFFNYINTNLNILRLKFNVLLRVHPKNSQWLEKITLPKDVNH